MSRATRAGLATAVHAIGDASVTIALDAYDTTGARGTVEHAQLVGCADLPRFAALGVAASVQPAHLLDDRDVAEAVWPGRADRTFPLRSLLDAGAELRLGSDAPVSRLDPWLAMAAAVHRSGDDRPPWTPSQQLTPAEALAASTDGWGTVAPGHPGDVVLLDTDPLAPAASSADAAAHPRGPRPPPTVAARRGAPHPRPSPPPPPSPTPRPPPPDRPSPRGRQGDPDGGAATGRVEHPGRPAVGRDERCDDRQPESGTTGGTGPGVVEAVEALEDPLGVLGGDARPVVAHLDDDLV